VWFDRVPLIDGAWQYAKEGVVPGGTHANHRFLCEWVDFGGVDREAQLILCDAQTSGGLLMAVPEDRATHLVEALQQKHCCAAAIVGRITAASGASIGRARVLPSAP
jgi:selenide,water dikinase